MWHLLRTEIQREKWLWFIICTPLILTLPYLIINDNILLQENLSTTILINLAKGFAILVALLFLRTFLSYLGGNEFSRFQMELPVAVYQLGMVRVGKPFLLWGVTCLLALINLLALNPPDMTKPILALFMVFGMTMLLLGLMFVTADILAHLSFVNVQHQMMLSLLIVFAPLIMFIFSKPKVIQSAFDLSNVLLINALALILFTISVYTFTHLKSYLFTPPIQ